MFMAQLTSWVISHHHHAQYDLWLHGRWSLYRLYFWAMRHGFTYQP